MSIWDILKQWWISDDWITKSGIVRQCQVCLAHNKYSSYPLQLTKYSASASSQNCNSNFCSNQFAQHAIMQFHMIWPILINPIVTPIRPVRNYKFVLVLRGVCFWHLLGATKTTQINYACSKSRRICSYESRSTALIYFDSGSLRLEVYKLKALPVFGSTVIQSRTTNRSGSDSEI